MDKLATFYVIRRNDDKYLKLGSDMYGTDIVEFTTNILSADKFRNINNAVQEARYHLNTKVVEVSFCENAEIQTVIIPACENHEGINTVDVNLRWVCPVCGQPRGKIGTGYSYDGSLRCVVDTWENPCGHIDKYSNVIIEAKNNGLNKGGGNGN